ncbi:adhesion G-protein coupled receptor G5-like [Denticeps clupeoides]|uniref:G-protein coupled receptor n=1 Tax=Denticeps clupeoides TaxID=299321 RepID=A0AAY4BG80_9TELE|nr:adhesion G-protein coupled receptor G5-like [Denticeps clupeoides]
MARDLPVGTALKIVSLFFLFGQGESFNNDRHWKMCGTWQHGSGNKTLEYDLRKGCSNITITANESSLSIHGYITARHNSSNRFDLGDIGQDTKFCLYWDPLLDQLLVEVDRNNYTVLIASGLQESCCTDLSHKAQQNKADKYGIKDAMIWTDPFNSELYGSHLFFGDIINCKREFCEKTSHDSRTVNMIEEAMMESRVVGRVNLECAQGSVLEMSKTFEGQKITLLSPRSKMSPTIYLPAGLRPLARNKAKVVCTYFSNNTLFKKSVPANNLILDDVVGISVENEVITDLSEPIKIGFHHSSLSTHYLRQCVSWDTRKEPNVVTWSTNGCKTVLLSEDNTECHCNHLTYFSILVQLEQNDEVRHLEALTFISTIGCTISAISCCILFYSLCKKSKKAQDRSTPVHRGLVVALFFLSVFFILTGVFASVGKESVCRIAGALLHYFLLSSLSWMAVEIFHTFWMIYMVFSTYRPTLLYFLGFVIPMIPVAVLSFRSDIYGVREIVPSDNSSHPFHMCWMKDSGPALLANYITNISFVAFIFCAGLVMLYLVFRKIRDREEWRKNRMTFLSILALSCLFGSTWGLTLISFGPLSTPVRFLFCILNSLQGFFIMLRYFALERVRKARDSVLDGSSTGSTRQHMLQTQEKS